MSCDADVEGLVHHEVGTLGIIDEGAARRRVGRKHKAKHHIPFETEAP